MDMKKVFIMKLGSSLADLRAERGDFDDWIKAPLGNYRDILETIDVRTGQAMPDNEEIGGIILTGSHAMVTDRHPWSEDLAHWLPPIVRKGIPVLGICYGHQLLAHALGGEVADNPRGWEFGTVNISFTDQARVDPLVGELFPAISAHVCHTQAVLRLPADARRLAYSERDMNQAFVVGDCAWGIQFHPEFDAAIAQRYIQQCSQLLSREGQDPDALLARCVDTGSGAGILEKFMEIVRRKQEENWRGNRQ